MCAFSHSAFVFGESAAKAGAAAAVKRPKATASDTRVFMAILLVDPVEGLASNRAGGASGEELLDAAMQVTLIPRYGFD
jgi:hypothetical protein